MVRDPFRKLVDHLSSGSEERSGIWAAVNDERLSVLVLTPPDARHQFDPFDDALAKDVREFAGADLIHGVA
ncbi:MAG TPA: hypothetical protein PKA24_20270, partial [Microthrixaceae bacterium]|nr:hypothetical protein [Microthrixaceae bacterium]